VIPAQAGIASSDINYKNQIDKLDPGFCRGARLCNQAVMIFSQTLREKIFSATEFLRALCIFVPSASKAVRH
jgi:hypothetical protein